MPPLAPFVFKLSFKLPSGMNQEKNVKHVDYITRPDAIDYGDLEPEIHAATPQAQAEEHGEDPEHVIYAQYIHERPRSQGLFSRDGPADFDATKDAISAHEGIVWRAVISLREDEAVRINHIDQSKWMESIQSSFPKIAEQLGISESNLEWVAAYHPEPGHPHCHIMFWEKEPERTRGMFSEGERRDVRKTFISNIYAQERERLFVEKTFYRDEIRKGVRDILGLRQELDRQTEIVRTELGDNPGIAPRITPGQEQELGQRLQSLSEILPGHGRVALGFMPEEVKAEVREIADWVLQQPGFVQEVEKYLEAHTQITSIYAFQENQINQAREKAYNDLRDRLSQDILKASTWHQRQEDRLSRSNPGESRNADFLAPGSDWTHQNGGNGLSVGEKEKKETEAWYRSTFRLVERERASVITGERLKLPEFNYQEGLDKLIELAGQIPDDFKGRPVIAFLPDELKDQAREAADWLLANSDMQSPLRDYLETVPGNPDAAYNQMRDWVAENAFAHALRLKVRIIEMPQIKMVLHEQRAQMAKEQLSGATADVVINDDKEARWTLFRMHEALTKIGASREDIREIITRWARDAGIESSVDRVLQRTYGGENDIDFIGRANWNRMCDNLGYHEHELLNPWMGQIVSPEEQEQEQETESTQQQPATPITPPDFLPEHVPAILETYDSVIANPELTIDKDELQWTIWTSSWVLKELGVDTQTRLQILNDWVQRSGIEMSQARVADTIHRANLVHEEDEDATPRWLGRDNWERLMRNIGAENPPDRPWEYPAQGFNLAGAMWKGLWQSIQRERTKSEYQARRMEVQREYEEKRRREGRDR